MPTTSLDQQFKVDMQGIEHKVFESNITSYIIPHDSLWSQRKHPFLLPFPTICIGQLTIIFAQHLIIVKIWDHKLHVMIASNASSLMCRIGKLVAFHKLGPPLVWWMSGVSTKVMLPLLGFYFRGSDFTHFTFRCSKQVKKTYNK